MREGKRERENKRELEKNCEKSRKLGKFRIILKITTALFSYQILLKRHSKNIFIKSLRKN